MLAVARVCCVESCKTRLRIDGRPFCGWHWFKIHSRDRRRFLAADDGERETLTAELADSLVSVVRKRNRGFVDELPRDITPARSLEVLRALIAARRLCTCDNVPDLRTVCRYVRDVILAHEEYREPTETFAALLRIVAGDGEAE